MLSKKQQLSPTQPWSNQLLELSLFKPPSKVSEGLKVAIGKLVLLTHVQKDKKSDERKEILLAISKNKQILQGLLNVLDADEEFKTSRDVICLFRELMAARSSWRPGVLPQCVSMNLTTTVLKALVFLFKHQELHDHSISCVFWVLSALATKDSKFSIKTRLCDGVKPISSLFRYAINKQRAVYPVLQVVKALSQNVMTAGVLGKDSVIPIVVSLINDHVFLEDNKKKNCPKLKTALECLFYLTKAKSNLVLMTKYGMCFGGISLMTTILEVFTSSDRSKAKFLHTVLSLLLHLVTIKLGRLQFLECNGLKIIEDFAFNLELEERRWNKCISRVSEIVSYCCKKQILLSEGERKCPISFDMPNRRVFSSQDSSRGTTPESEDESKSEDSDSDDDNQEEDRQSQDLEYRKDEKKIYFTSSLKKAVGRSTNELDDIYGNIFKEFREPFISKNSPIEISGKFSLPKTSTSFHYNERFKQVSRIYPFVKIALPDILLAESPSNGLEPLLEKNRKAHRIRELKNIKKMLYGEEKSWTPRVVYDLDQLLSSTSESPNEVDEDPLSDEWCFAGPTINEEGEEEFILSFDSRFESGNLRRAVRVSPNEYDLILTPDVNSVSHYQWFYYRVTNTKSEVPYVFNIINYEKKNSQFNFGMQPVFFSSIAALQYGSPVWKRIGSEIGYRKNNYTTSSEDSVRDFYMTATFTIQFPYDDDAVYIAYHFPYTYTRLRVVLDKLKWKQERNSSIYYREDILGYSLCRNEIPVLTLTSSSMVTPITDKEIIVLTGRVHPGETNSSWIMEGTIRFLLSDHSEAKELRDNYIFKIVPMINVEGVIHGLHRCGLTGEDLNRQWMNPSQTWHPSVYHSKGLIEYCQRVLKKPLFLFCDYHGHSRKKNVFLYGCSSPSFLKSEKLVKEEEEIDPQDFRELEKILTELAPYFDSKSCSYTVEKSRETTARVVVWKEFGIDKSYTMESTFCGCNRGTMKGMQISTHHLMDMGSLFARGLNRLDYEEYYDEVPGFD